MMDQTTLILSDRIANQSNQIQTHSQMCHRSTGHSYCTQTCEFYSTEQQKPHNYKSYFFYKTTFFSLCYIPVVSIETPLRMTTVLFCSGGGDGGGGGSFFFFCVNVKSQNSTRRVSILCVLVLYSFGHCASQFTVVRQLTQRVVRGEEKGRHNTRTFLPLYTLLAGRGGIHTPYPTELVSECYMRSIWIKSRYYMFCLAFYMSAFCGRQLFVHSRKINNYSFKTFCD